jgi:ATP-binding cassette subfamily F protein uup
MLKADEKLYDIFMRYSVLDKIVNSDLNTDEKCKEYTELSKQLQNLEFHKYEAKIYKILNGLGFNDKTISTKSLSGGQNAKLSLAKSLLIEPELLLFG